MKKIIFGAGLIGEHFLLSFYNDVDYVWDNKKQGSLLGCAIEKPFYNDDYFVIVTVKGAKEYQSIKIQLESLGYTEFENFIPYTIYQRKMAIAYGNCHMNAVKQYLEQSRSFSDEYGFYPLPQIQDMDNVDDFTCAFNRCELFIHQDIRNENRYGLSFASEQIKNKLGENTKLIVAPNLYGLPKCFFPQLFRDDREVVTSRPLHNGYDSNILRWMDEGKTKEEIRDLILSGETYSESYIREMWDEFIAKLKNREEKWDIKISDFILKNYRSCKLFAEPWHIMPIVAREIANRILAHMDYTEQLDFELDSDLDLWEVFCTRK